jgi:hypothetical protein
MNRTAKGRGSAMGACWSFTLELGTDGAYLTAPEKLVDKPQEQGYDDHSSKFFSVVKPRLSNQ